MIAVTALIPVFFVIAVGWAARASKLAPEDGFAALNKLGYWLFYPAFLFSTIAKADFSDAGAATFVFAMMTGFLAMGAIGLLLKPVAGGSDAAFTSVFQAGARWNGFVLLAAAAPLFGPEGPGLVALAFGPLVVVANLQSVAVMARWGTGGDRSLGAMARAIVGNPLILACVAGLGMKLSGGHTPALLVEPLDLLGRAALPMALIGVGAGLSFRGVMAAPRQVTVATIYKVLLGPPVMWAAASAWGVSGTALAVAVAVGATPTAAASYVLAREMGGDAPLMAAIVTATTIASAITMPFALAIGLHLAAAG